LIRLSNHIKQLCNDGLLRLSVPDYDVIVVDITHDSFLKHLITSNITGHKNQLLRPSEFCKTSHTTTTSLFIIRTYNFRLIKIQYHHNTSSLIAITLMMHRISEGFSSFT